MNFGHRRSAEDFDDEIESHLALETERLMAEGLSERDARAAARREFGNLGAAQERFHRATHNAVVEGVVRDTRYALRGVRRSPVFALVAVLCLAVAIGVNTTAFSILNAMLFRDYPGIHRQDRLVSIYVGHDTEFGPTPPGHVAYADYVALRDGVASLDGLAAAGRTTVAARGKGEPTRDVADLVSGNFFEVLGTLPSRGRLFVDADDRPGAPPVVVVTHAYWERALGASANAIGSTLHIAGHPFTIVGVAPRDFFGTHPGELLDPERGAPTLFIPLVHGSALRGGEGVNSAAPAATADDVDDRWLRLIGRMRDSATLDGLNAQANVVEARISATHPRTRAHGFALVKQGLTSPRSESENVGGVLVVMSVPLLILLVACANLANHLLARGLTRSREIAIRLTLGATRARVVRGLLVESMVLAIAGSIGGLLAARVGLDGLRATVLPLAFPVPIDSRVLLFAVLMTFATALLFGLVPALRATRTDLASATKEGATGYRHSLLRNALLVGQLATSVALLALAGLFVRANTRHQPEHRDVDRLFVPVDVSLLDYDATRGKALQRAALDRLRALPGVMAVGLGTAPPLVDGTDAGRRPVAVAGETPRTARWFKVDEVSGDWFTATARRLLHGRYFADTEQRGVPLVAVVDEAFVRERWPESGAVASAIGRSVRVGSDTVRTVTIIGVVASERTLDGSPPGGTVILPGGAGYTPVAYLHIRTASSAAAMAPVIRAALRSVDSDLPIPAVRTLDDLVSAESTPLSLLGAGMSALGLVAIMLAAIGLFAMQSFMVVQRRFEIGVRIALGALSRDVVRMVVANAVRLAAMGIAIGAVAAAGIASLLRALLYGLSPFDPVSLGASAVLLLAVAAAASLIPAWRAAKGDPMLALRGE